MKGLIAHYMELMGQVEENVMKGLIAHYMELMGQVEFCPYCMEEKEGKTSCCQENHFVPFSDLDTDSKLEIIKKELV